MTLSIVLMLTQQDSGNVLSIESSVALHCCKAHSEINRKMENSTPCKIVTPQNFIMKLGTRDYVDKVTLRAVDIIKLYYIDGH